MILAPFLELRIRAKGAALRMAALKIGMGGELVWRELEQQRRRGEEEEKRSGMVLRGVY